MSAISASPAASRAGSRGRRGDHGPTLQRPRLKPHSVNVSWRCRNPACASLGPDIADVTVRSSCLTRGCSRIGRLHYLVSTEHHVAAFQNAFRIANSIAVLASGRPSNLATVRVDQDEAAMDPPRVRRLSGPLTDRKPQDQRLTRATISRGLTLGYVIVAADLSRRDDAGRPRHRAPPT